MESENFICVCHMSIPFIDDESIFYHILDCETYKKISPNTEIFNSIPLIKLDLGQLIALKTEYNMYLRGIDEELKKSSSYNSSI